MEIDMLDPPPESSSSVKDTMAWSSYLKDLASAGASGTPGHRKREEFCHRVGTSRPIYLIRNKKRNPNWEDFREREDESVKEEDEDEEDEEGERSRPKDDGNEMEVKQEPEEECGDGKCDGEKNDGKPLEPQTDGGDALDKSATATASSSSTSTTPTTTSAGATTTAASTAVVQAAEAEDKTEEDQTSSMMQDAATLASLSRGGRTLEEEEEEEDESRGVKRRAGGGGGGGGDSDGGLGDDEDDDEKEPEGAGGKRRKIGPSPDGGSARRMHSIDTTSVKFSHNSYHHVFVNKTGLIMFQPNRIARTNACHKQVTQHKYSHMSEWTQRWVARSTTPQQREDCTSWLMGHAADSRANRTSARTVDRPERTPYRPYTRYCLEWVAAANTSVASVSATTAGNGRTSPQGSV